MLSDVDRMDNFLKTYMPAGGEVSLSWSRIKTALVELGTTPNTGSPKCAQCNEYVTVSHCEINAEPDSPFCHKYRTLRAGA